MRVFLLATGQDTAGMGGRIASAFARLVPEWNVVSMIGSTNYMHYPGSLPFARGRGPNGVQTLWDKADVVHLRNDFSGQRLYGRQDRKQKPLVLHHHGTIYRENPEKFNREAANRGAIQLASTIDLTLLGPNVAWCPSPYNPDKLAAIRAKGYTPHGDEVIRIAHAPTNRAIKGTEDTIRAIEVLRERGYPVEFDLIERETNAVCLVRKANADIFIDQTILGYGCNAIEAWGMGMPVVAGVTDPDVRALMLQTWGELPFVDCAPGVEPMIEVLTRLIESKRERNAAAKRGAEHFAKYHDDRVLIPQLVDIYQRAARREV